MTSLCARLYGRRSAKASCRACGFGSEGSGMIATYQTRIVGYVGLDRTAGDAALDAYGELCGRVQRKLFADAAAGGSKLLLKSEYLKCYGIPARMFNAVRVSLQGKVASVRESQKFGLVIFSDASTARRSKLPRPRSEGSWIRHIISAVGW